MLISEFEFVDGREYASTKEFHTHATMEHFKALQTSNINIKTKFKQ